jgi:hypothetical protein
MTKVRADRTVIVIGVFLFILGLAVAWNGYGYVLNERGWTMVISGTVAFSTGLILIALGLVLRELRAIAGSAGRATLLLAKAKTLQLKDFDDDSFAAAPPPVPVAPPPLPPRAFESEERAAVAEFAPDEEEFEAPAEKETKWKAERTLRLHLPRVDEVAVAGASLMPNPLAWMVRPEKAHPAPSPPIQDEEFESWEEPEQDERLAQPPPQETPWQESWQEPPRQEPPSPAQTLPVAELPPEPLEAEDLSGSLDAPEPAPHLEAEFAPEAEPAHLPEPPEAEPEPRPEFELAPEPEPVSVPETAPGYETEPQAAAPAEDVGAPEIIGHYEAHGAHYTMYADGSIDADTAHGVYRFASMEELKEFIARQEP